MSHDDALRAMRASLQDLQQKRTSIGNFCQSWRAQSDLLTALPPRYSQVMEDFLGRMEASSLFTEESCSFSHEDLQAGLASWLDKAGQQLAGGNRANP